MSQEQAAAVFESTINETVSRVAAVIHDAAQRIDAAPSGLDAIVLVSTLRAFAKLVSMPFDARAVEAAEKLAEELHTKLVEQAMRGT